MLNRLPNYLSVSDFIAFADAVDAFNATLPDGKHLNVYYIPLRRHTKIPATSKPMYTIDNNGKEIPRPKFVMSRKRATDFLANNWGNIGILAYNDHENPTLALFDFDIAKNPEDGIGTTIVPKEQIFEFAKEYGLPISITRQGGYHVYAVNDGSLTNANLMYNGRHAGELRCHKMYVVAPGSHVPKTSEDDEKKGKIPTPEANGTYRMLSSRPFKEVSKDRLPGWLSLDTEINKKRHKMRQVTIRPLENIRGGNDIYNDLGVNLTTIRARDELLDKMLLGATESDRSRADFKAAWRLRAWGFDDSAIAHILRAYRSSDKTDREDYIELTISKAVRDYEFHPYLDLMNDLATLKANEKKIELHTSNEVRAKLKGEDSSTSEVPEGYITGDGVFHLSDFPTVLPDYKYVHLRGLPRIGKSHWTLTQLAAAGNGIYVTANHDIIAQQFQTFHRLAPDKTAVWLKGKQRCCTHTDNGGRKFNCLHCPLRPRSQWDENADPRRPTEEQAERAVCDRLKMDGYLCYSDEPLPGSLSADEDVRVSSNIPTWLCPYYALRIGADEADFIFTVPYYTTELDEITNVGTRDLMVLDEDTVFKFYAPKTVSLLEYGFVGGVTTFIIKSQLTNIVAAYAKIKEAIEVKNRQTYEDKVILTVISNYEAIEEAIAKVARNEHPVKYAVETREWLKKTILLQLSGKFEGLSYYDRLAVIEAIEEYSHGIDVASDDDGVVEYTEAMLFPNKANMVFWENGNPATLYLIADESKIIRTPSEAKQYLIVGFTGGELFAEQMARKEYGPEWNDHIAKLHIQKFPYGENFVVYRVSSEKKNQERKIFRQLVRAIDTIDNGNSWRIPRLTLTASKKHQTAFEERTSSDTAVMLRRKHGLPTIDLYGGLMGASMIFYSNSRISRGIDVPKIDLLIADSCTFAQPYVNASIAALKSQMEAIEYGAEGDPEVVKRRLYKMIKTKNSLLTDETTNGVLRISPVRGYYEDQAKAIVIASEDFDFINAEASSKMHMVEVSDETDLMYIADSITRIPRKVNPTHIMQVAASVDSTYAQAWDVIPAEVGAEIIAGGCVKTQLPDLLQVLTPEQTADPAKAESKMREAELAEKILSHPALQAGDRLKIGSLQKWAYNRYSKQHSRAEIDRVIKKLIIGKKLEKSTGYGGGKTTGRKYTFVAIPGSPVSRTYSNRL
ncbi:MAG: hypothetical protein WCR85_00280 [Sphaerochaeta sp.]